MRYYVPSDNLSGNLYMKFDIEVPTFPVILPHYFLKKLTTEETFPSKSSPSVSSNDWEVKYCYLVWYP